MSVIVTVHGTSSGAPEDEGPKWWQRGSEFQQRLSRWLDFDKSEITVEPFHWGEGPNSELARRKAGTQLLKRLRTYERHGQDYYLIGHSHGGSVIYHALLEASSRKIALPHLKQWITIGTPFIWMQRKRLFVQRLSHMGKIGYAMMIGSVAGLLIGGPTTVLYGKEMYKALIAANPAMTGDPSLSVQSMETSGMLDLQMVMQLIATPLFAVMLFVWLRWRRARSERRYAEATRKFFQAQFVDRWHSLRSGEDEAINALRAAKPLKVSLFQKNILTEPLKNAVVFGTILIFAFMFVWQTVAFLQFGFSQEYFERVWTNNPFGSSAFFNLPDFKTIAPNPVDFSKAWHLVSDGSGTGIGVLLGGSIGLPLSLAMMAGILWLFFSALHIIGYIIGMPVSWFLNWLTSGSLRNKAYGNDTIGENVLDVMPMPENCDRNCGRVPDNVEQALRAHAEKNAAQAFARARAVLGLKSELEGKGDIAQVMGEQLTGGELVHTAYFDVDPFAKLIAAALHASGCARFSDELRQSDDCEALLTCLEQTQSPVR